MKAEKQPFVDIDDYISRFPEQVQVLLEAVRKAIREIVPEAKECISYQIPTFKLHRNLVHFAGYKHHIGFYPGAGAIKTFEAEIANYKSAKGSVQFPIDEPIPFDLIKKITAFRVEQENMKNVTPKTTKSKSDTGFMELLSAPAQRALTHAGIKTLQQLSVYTEASLLKLHGFGKASLPILRHILAQEGLRFKV